MHTFESVMTLYNGTTSRKLTGCCVLRVCDEYDDDVVKKFDRQPVTITNLIAIYCGDDDVDDEDDKAKKYIECFKWLCIIYIVAKPPKQSMFVPSPTPPIIP